MVIGDIVVYNARAFAHRTGLVNAESGVRLTWHELNRRVNSLAMALLESGLRKGDRVAFVSENCHQAMELMFAAAKCGIVQVGLNYRLTGEQLEFIVKQAEPRLIFAQNKFSRLASSLQSKTDAVEGLIGWEDGHTCPSDYEDFLAAHPAREPGIEVSEDDLFAISFTSGTTARPKGVAATHKNRLMPCIYEACLTTRFSPSDVVLVSLPLVAFGGQALAMDACFAGATLVVDVLRGRTWAEHVARERVTVTSLTKTRVKLIREFLDSHRSEYDLSSLRRINLGGQRMTAEEMKDIFDYFGVPYSAVYPYGTTESNYMVTALLPDELAAGLSPSADEKQRRRVESVGKPLMGVKLRVADENGDSVAAGQLGEILLGGDSISPYYWRDPERTEKTFRNGWYCTGDMGTIDEDGYLYFKGRKDYVVKSGGFLVSPVEVEGVILLHPAVAEAAVIGVPDEKWGEVVRAVVSLKQGQAVDEQELRDHCRKHLGGFQIPKSIHFLPELPKDSNERVVLRELKTLIDPGLTPRAKL